MKIIYMGTPYFAVPCLKHLVSEGYDVCLVVTQPDKPVGRKQILTPSDVKKVAIELGLEVYQPTSLRTEEAYLKLKSYNSDFLIVAAYGKILPQNILDIPKYAPINVHGSLLPLYRGAAPIQRTVIDGQKTAGITTMLMEAGLDTGDMLLKYETPVDENMTAGELFDFLANKAPDLLIETLEGYVEGKILPQKQDQNQATYAPMLSKDEAIIDWSCTSLDIHNKVRGMNPWPVAQTSFSGKKLKLYRTSKTELYTEKDAGTVIVDKSRMFLACGDGKLLEVLEIQLEGGKKLDTTSFLAGHRDIDGTVLG